MKKFSLFGCEMCTTSCDSSSNLQSHGAVKKVKPGGGYYMRSKDLGKIHRAAYLGNLPEVQRLLLLRPGRLNDRDQRDRTALHLACAYGHLEVVTLLLDRKCELNLRDNMNRTALMKAVHAQEEECVSLLLEHGADPNMKDTYGYTALHHAAHGQSERIAAELLQHQADMEAKNKNGFTPLLLASNGNNEKMVRFLIRKNADISAVDNNRRTALMLAVKDESSNIVRLLLQQGIDVFAVDFCGLTAEEHAHFRGCAINHQLISDCQRERRYKECSEDSSIADKCSKEDLASSLPCKPGIDGSQSTSQDNKDFNVDPKDEPTKPAIGKIKNVQMSALGLGEEEDIKASWDSENVPERRPQKSVDPFLFAAKRRGKYILPNQVQEIHFSMESEKEQVRLDGSENNHHCEAWEQNDTQRRRSREQNDRMLQDAMLTIDFCKQKVKEIDVKKKNSEVSDSHEKQKDLLRETSILRLKLDTDKNKHQEMEKKCFEDIAIIKGETDHLQNTVELNEETLMEATFQYDRQLNVLTAETKRLSSQLGSAKQNRERLETEVESYHSELATAIQGFEQSQKSKRDIWLTFQRATEELCGFRDKLNLEMSNLKHNYEILSQQLSNVESKFSSLETVSHHTRNVVREANLVLECLHRDLNQTQCQKTEIEHMYQSEREKVNTYVAKVKCLEERCSHLQRENLWLRQQWDDARNKSRNEKRIINIQGLMQDVIKLFQAQTEKLVLMVEESNKELINECTHLNERVQRLEKIEAEREVDVRQLQQELADHLKELALSEASLEVLSHDRMNLEAERQGLMKTSEQMRRQLEEAQD